MTEPERIAKLRKAKEALVERYRDQPWFRGAGIASSPSGLVLRLNVDPKARVSKDEAVPEVYGDLPIEVVYIAGYEPRVVQRTTGKDLPGEEEL